MKPGWISAIAVVLLTVLSCKGGKEVDGKITVAVLRGPSAVEAVQLADSLSKCTDPGIRVLVYDEPLRLRKEMMEGNVDYCILPMTLAALMYNKGTDYRIAAVPIWGSLYLCGEDTSITEIVDLRGKSINVMARGMTPDILLQRLLRNSGLEPGRDVTTDYRFPTHIDLANAAIAGRARLCVLSEPFLSQALNANPKLHILIDLGQEFKKSEGVPLPETALLCKGEKVYSAKNEIGHILEMYRRSAQWVNEHPDSASVLAVAFGINPDAGAVMASIPRSNFKVVGTAEAEKEIKCYLRIFLDACPESIGGRMPDEEFFIR